MLRSKLLFLHHDDSFYSFISVWLVTSLSLWPAAPLLPSTNFTMVLELLIAADRFVVCVCLQYACAAYCGSAVVYWFQLEEAKTAPLVSNKWTSNPVLTFSIRVSFFFLTTLVCVGPVELTNRGWEKGRMGGWQTNWDRQTDRKTKSKNMTETWVVWC